MGHRGAYPGALSRTDNVTEICSNCGTMEAISQMGAVMQSQHEWPLEGGPTRDLQDILNDPENLGYADPDGMDLPPFEPGVDDLGDGRFLIRRGYEDPDAGPRISRGGDRIADAIRRGYYGDDTHSGLAGDEWTGDDMNPVGPDYDQPDPFDTSNPEEAAQAENIEETEQLFSRWDEERDRNRRGLDGRSRES